MHLLHHPRDYTEFPAVVDFIRDDTNPVRLPVRSRTRRTVRSFASSSVFVSESRDATTDDFVASTVAPRADPPPRDP